MASGTTVGAWLAPAGGVLRAPDEPDAPDVDRGLEVLARVREHLASYINAPDEDIDLLVLWAAHTHLAEATYTSPRLLLDSPLPGSGKTTVLEHLERLCINAVSMASISSDAMLPRLIDSKGIATILIDEADRSLRPDKQNAQELIAILNSGYKRGSTRPTLVPTKDGGWEARELPTFSPVAMAGNSPNLADDTMSRTIRVLLLPDVHGDVEETAWEVIDETTRALGSELADWAAAVRDHVATNRGGTLPHGVRGRRGECWRPLLRVAAAAGGRWPEVVADLILRDQEELALAREDGATRVAPHVQLVQDIAAIWPMGGDGEPAQLFPTTEILTALIRHRPDTWSRRSSLGTDLTAKRLGHMLTKSFKIHSTRPGGRGPRGYTPYSFERVWRSMRVDPPSAPSDVLAADIQPCMVCGDEMAPAAAVGGFDTHPTCGGAA